VHKKIILKMEN